MKKVIAYIALALVLAFVVLVLLSWLLSATMGEGVHSLLSSEGIRFFFGGFVDVARHPLLVWLLLLSMAWGCLSQSGLLQYLPFVTRSMNDSPGQSGYKRPFGGRRGSFLLVVMLVLYVGVILLLTVTPHAVLLSATGRLWPSPFSRALVPVVAFGLILLSTVYGVVSRRFLSLSDVCQSLTGGIAAAAPLLMLYVLASQLYAAVSFVFGI